MKIEIETKFNVNQTVYFVKNNKIHEGQINNINIHVYKWKDGMTINHNYRVWDLTENICLPKLYLENDIFASKEELIAQL